MSNKPAPRVIVALDNMTPSSALQLATQFAPDQCGLKIGKELFTKAGPVWVRELTARGFAVFLDLKFHDIPNTVAKACEAAAELGVWMINVHALGGRKMMSAARAAVAGAPSPPLLIAVTILTSLDNDDLLEVGLTGSTTDNVLRLASLAQSCGLDGVVCSAHEAALLKKRCGRDFVLVTPGIRPLGSQAQDQQRTMTPAEAIQQGSDYLVIGRPITGADNPRQTLLTVQAEIADSL